MLDSITGGILSDRDIGWQLLHGGLVIEPLLRPIQSASVDLRLGDQIIIPRGGRTIDPLMGIGLDDTPESFASYLLLPDQFVNVSTLETIHIPPHLVGFVVGKSTYARLGLQIESAGLVDPGWNGKLTCELKNLGPDTIMLRPGMKICQIYFLVIFDNPVKRLYGDPLLRSHYQGATGPETGKVDPLEYLESALLPEPRLD